VHDLFMQGIFYTKILLGKADIRVVLRKIMEGI
jgi:hypothetical protein